MFTAADVRTGLAVTDDATVVADDGTVVNEGDPDAENTTVDYSGDIVADDVLLILMMMMMMMMITKIQ
ncbi:hypothetical protein SNE40_000422 [Patella caerulea]|uniref:Uncharacterized protein n=1 Tax=Patella caerulea TaxID=87958 RepID=A0AAN8KEL0_PATCE